MVIWGQLICIHFVLRYSVHAFHFQSPVCFSVLKWPRSVGLKRHNYKFLFIFSHIGTPCVSSLITSEKPDQWEHSRHTKFVTAGQTFLLRCVIVRRFAAENVRNKDCCRHVASLLKVCVCGGLFTDSSKKS